MAFPKDSAQNELKCRPSLATPKRRVRSLESIMSVEVHAFYKKREAQMKISSSVFTLTFLSLILTGLLTLGTAVSGFAGTPHTCPAGTHQGSSLGGVANMNFVFAKDCSPDTSLAVRWKAFVYNDSTGVLLCQLGEIALPPYTQTVYCPSSGSLPRYIKAVINYKTSPLGSWMTHTEYYTNP
jgi:hypothetical protein